MRGHGCARTSSTDIRSARPTAPSFRRSKTSRGGCCSCEGLMADLFQIEAYRTFEYYGFFVDHIPDAQRIEWRDGLPVPRAINSGRADNIIMGGGGGCAVEVKTAGGANYRRLAF